MGEPSTLIGLLALLSMAFVVGSATYIAWRRRNLSGRTASLVILVAGAEWALACIMAPLSDATSTALFWDKLRLAGETLVPAGWLLFSLRYAGRSDWMGRRWLAIPAILPTYLMTVGFIFDIDGRLGSPWVDLLSPANLEDPRTPLGWLFLAYSTALLAMGAYQVFRTPSHTAGLYRGQAYILLWVAALPALGSALGFVGWRPVSYLYLAPAGLAVASLILAWDLSHIQRGEILPVARDVILASMSDGVLVLDDQKRVVDVNPALCQLIGQSPSDMKGRLLSQAWPRCPTVISEATTSDETSMEVILRYEERWRTYDVRVSPLLDWQGRVVSRVVVLRDITARKRAELTSAAFAALGQRLNSSSSAEDAAGIIAEVADELFGWDACFLAHYAGEQDALLPVFQANAPHLPASAALRLGNWQPPLDAIRQAMSTGGLLLDASEPGDQASTSGKDQAAAQSTTSVMLVPVRLGVQPVGVLAIQRCATRTYDEEDLDTLQALSDHCSGALERLRATQAMRASEERYRTLFEDSPISIWEEDFSAVKNRMDQLAAGGVTDVRRYLDEHPEEIQTLMGLIKVLELNRSTIELYKANSKTDLLGDLNRILDDSTLAAHKASLLAIAEGKRRLEMEIVNRTLTGDLVDGLLRWSVAPTYEVTYGRVLVSIMDLTERRRAEEAVRASLKEKEVLLKEIHHRVKNNLQVISSLLNLQSHTMQDGQARELLRESQNRVRSMAMVHERLYRSADLASVDFAEYTKGLVASLFRSYSAREGVVSRVDAPAPVAMVIDSAIPCGLIINELVSNTLKYAFPDGKTGEVRVHLGQDSKGQVSLTVSDNGVGLPPDLDFRETESLGLQLVTTLVEQLEGTIELDRSSGTTFRISFPGLVGQADSGHNNSKVEC